MKQYLEALKNREEVTEEVIVELEERFKVVEEEIIDTPTVTLEERIEVLEMLELERIFGGI